MVLSLGKLKFLARWMVNVARFRMIQYDEGDDGDDGDDGDEDGFHLFYLYLQDFNQLLQQGLGDWGAGAGAGAGAGRKALWSIWRNLDHPNLQNLSVQMDVGPMDHLQDVILDRQFGRWSNGPPMRRKFGPSIWMMDQWTTCET